SLYRFSVSSRRRHTRSKRDWSSDVCSSDLDEMDRISMKHHHKENELALMIHKITMKDFIQSKIKEHNISEEEINAQYKRFNQIRSEERRVGKEYRSRCAQ